MEAEILALESRKCFDYFWNEVNINEKSTGFGLIRDRAPGNPKMASIAAVGFGLTALAIGVERRWITFEQGYNRALGTLETLWKHAEHIQGFFYHFLHVDNGKRFSNCEVSVIDTALAVCGMLTAGEYFGSMVKQKSKDIYLRINWKWYTDQNRKLFYMGYTPERGHWGEWNCYAEQLMLYFLGAASPTHSVDPEMFYVFNRQKNTCLESSTIVYTPIGSLFTYQFTHAWFDLRDSKDDYGVDWWENSVLGSKTNYRFCINQGNKFKTLGPCSWGLTACDGPKGYSGAYGAPPSGGNNKGHFTDGTIAPCGAAGSIVFTPEESINALEYYYKSYPELWGKYGFTDAYNLDVSPPWFDKDCIGIDKGITLLMIENYRTGFVWETFMKSDEAKRGLFLTGVNKQVNESAYKHIAAAERK